MELKSMNLRPNWSLLDSTFESYKLSLQQLPINAVETGCKPDYVTLPADQFSYNRTKAVSMQNYLFGDPWSNCDCYFVDNAGHIRRIAVIVESSIEVPKSVFQLGPHSLQAQRLTPVTLTFPSANLCLVSDGAGLMYLLDTGNRQDAASKDIKWNVILNEEVIGDGANPVMLLHSCLHFDKCEAGEKSIIEVVTLRFEDDNTESSLSTVAVIDWTTLIKSHEGSKFVVDRHRTFKGKQAPFYAMVGEKGGEIFLGSNSPLNFVPDWDQQVLNEEMDVNNVDAETESQEPLYNWSQTSEDVSISIPMPEWADKKSVIYNLSTDNIHVSFRDAEGNVSAVLDGKLFSEADIESSNWSIVNKNLEITIQKQVEPQTWPCVIPGDMRGQLKVENTETNGTSSEMLETEVRGLQPTGLDGYEDCDDLPDVDSMLYRFDAATNKFTHEASAASNQWLFNCFHENKWCTVLRHDIDALVWESSTPNELSANPWKHVATFNALGYVKASKEDIKYSGCSPNASYSALCDSNRRVFVYHSPTTTAAPLRNRSTGKQLHVSKQQVVTLPSNDPIIGFHATTELMFVLTDPKIFIIKVNAPDT